MNNSPRIVSTSIGSIVPLAILASGLFGLSLPNQAKTLVFPHALEVSGKVSNTQFTFDTTFFLTYNGGLGDLAANGGATVDLYVYDSADGQPLRGANGTVVCNPCTYDLNELNRKRTVVLDDLIVSNGGGFDVPNKNAFVVAVIGGADPDGVVVQGFVVNSHTSAFDLSVFGFDPQPLLAERIASSPTNPVPKAFVIPHVLERSGTITTTTNTFDTQLIATYVSGLAGTPAGQGASIDLYLFDEATGQPMRGTNGKEVCNPCAFALGDGAAGTAAPRKRSIRIDDLIVGNGGGFPSEEMRGFAIIVPGGRDPAGVNLQGFVVNSHTSAFDLSVFGFNPQPVISVTENPPPPCRTFVIPHVLEKSGTIAATTDTFDTTLFATYTGGLAGVTNAGGAAIELYLYDQTGQPMRGASGQDVCNPCSFNLGTGAATDAAPRKRSIRIDDLIQSKGGFETEMKLGYGVVVVSGADPDSVNLQSFVVNSHSGPFDLSVFGFDPVPLESARVGGGGGAGGAAAKTFVIPHILERSGTIADTQFTFDTTLFATYAGGQAGSPTGPGATLDLYLLDQATGQPMRGVTGPVCAPCTFQLNGNERKQTINIDDLIVSKGGGFDQSVKLGFGVVVIEGDVDNVNLQGFVVNSHTSAFDLSVFGFEPQEISAARAAGTLPLLSLSGQVSGAGVSGAGVTMNLSGTRTRSLVTDPAGLYSFFVPSNGNYTIAPFFPGKTFTPPNRRFTGLNSNQVANFSFAPDLVLLQPAKDGQGFHFVLRTGLGLNYTIEYKSSVTDTQWTQLTTITGDGADRTVTDQDVTQRLRLYRARQD